MNSQRLIAVAFLGCAAFGWFSLPKPPLLDGIEFSSQVTDRHGELLHTALTSGDKLRVFTPLERISPELIEATLLHEDRFFFRHPGINPVPVLRTAWSLARRGGAEAGASTITMQLARIRFSLETRTLPGKLRQMCLALQLERHYSKRAILEAYLNLAPYGGNVEGVGAASALYLRKSPAELTLPEAVMLSVIPQSPARRTPRAGIPNDALTAAYRRLFARLATTRRVDPLCAAYIPTVQPPRSMRAPHLTTRFLASAEPGETIRSTIDLRAQAMMEQRIAAHVARNHSLGVRNAACMLVDARTMDVLALAGSADFWNDRIHGQVDGTRSRRSPGSALKPFVYALAMEQGVIHPLSMVVDAPRSFGSYNPENYERDFAGPIPAANALARSRNVPAVALASQLARPTLFEFLRKGGVKLPSNSDHYGLSLPLGGAEVTMEELVRLYSILANDGELRPLRIRLDEPGTKRGTRMLSPEASFLVLEMLSDANRPDVSWKTGTSHGFRDAWAVAVFDHYILAVWVGNFDGEGNPAFVGRTCAGPLLFHIIDGLRVRPAPHDPPAHANLRRIEFCAVSGALPSADCPHRVEGWFIPGISPIEKCGIHRAVLVDAASGLRVPFDDGSRVLRREVFEFWPSNLMALFDRAGLPRRRPPPFLTGTNVEALARSGNAPRIVSPRPGGTYSLVGGESNHRALALRAETDSDASRLYWFANKTFVGTSSLGQPLDWHPAPGKYIIVALDDHGRSTSSEVTLQAVTAD